jgi:glycosyltransferase involved in cell wall biosynthesis
MLNNDKTHLLTECYREKRKMELTVLMPCLNEAETLGVCIRKAKLWMEQRGIQGEVLVADNGSSDGSHEIAIIEGAVLHHVEDLGYGAALYSGALAAKGKYIIMGDSDDSYDFSNLDDFIQELRGGVGLVMGNRFTGGISPGAMPWKNRYIGNPILSWVGRILFKIPIRDFHCGLRGFSKQAFEKMDLRTTGMEFASEMIIKAKLVGIRISEVDTTLSKDGRSRPPHLNPWRDGYRHLRFMFSLSPKYLFLVPGSILALLGLVFYIPLLFGDLILGSARLGVNTLFMTQAMFLLGYVAIIWGIVMRIFGSREGLLPLSPKLTWFMQKPILEIGSMLSVVVIALGVLLSAQALQFWASIEFGALDPKETLRKISLASTFLLFGGTSLFGSLMFGFLSLPLRRRGYIGEK